ncbi:MAG: lipopolysaccharide assembly protein LapB [Xanthomonadales bacterium]|nr:lipopolysaccharide assembly protein LapB [Xanthomonadales bacterium]
MFELGLFWLLLPVVAAASWFFARTGTELVSGARVDRLSSGYFRGLSHLLNEEPDKAIEVFLSIAELDQEAVETQLALGSLFRRRGEVGRAIRLHQDLLKRDNLSKAQKTAALFELGEDYLRAGLLDRSEALFSDLVAADIETAEALRKLVTIYEAERDWPRAIDHAERLEQLTGRPQGTVIAHYRCELAERARSRGQLQIAQDELEQALKADPNCARAEILAAGMAMEQGDVTRAVRTFERAARVDMDVLPLLLDALMAGYEQLGDNDRARQFLTEMCARYPGIAPVLALSRHIARDQGEEAAETYLARELRHHPSVAGLSRLAQIGLRRASEETRPVLVAIAEVADRMIDQGSGYLCRRCGFGARSHHWQCPSCKSWDTLKPQHRLLGE